MSDEILYEVTQNEYKYGFTTDIETEIIPPGLDEDVVRLISQKKNVFTQDGLMSPGEI